MNKTVLVLKHELTQTLRRKSFIIMSLAFPLLALAAIGVFQVIESTEPAAAEVINIGYVDEVGIFSGYTEQ